MRDRGWWKEPIEAFGFQTLSAVLQEHEGDDVGDHVLAYAMSRPWFQDLRPRFETLGALGGTGPCRPDDERLQQVLCDLYAASRVRDVLLFARQPEPLDPEASRSTNSWLGRTEPAFGVLPLDQFEAFFAALGCRVHATTGFDPAVHEIVVCDSADDPAAPITVVEQLWPALLIGELVFCRAGVRVRSGADHAVPGVADRSTLHHTYWRRHRPTDDGSMGWGSRSQWRTWFRRDYLTERGPVFDLDAAMTADHPLDRTTDDGPTAAEIDARRRHRSWLTRDWPDELPPDATIDGRRPPA